MFQPLVYPVAGAGWADNVVAPGPAVRQFTTQLAFVADVDGRFGGPGAVFNGLGPGTDLLFDNVLLCNIGIMEPTSLPDTFFDQIPRPIVRSEFPLVSVEEPLFGFCGTTPFKPTSVYPLVEYLPGFIQDYDLLLVQKKNQDMLNRPHETLPPRNNSLIVETEPVGNYVVTVRSADLFDQKEKPLQKANIPYPLFVRFDGPAGIATKCVTNHGLPDAIFIRVERVYEESFSHVSFEPYIRTLKMNVLYQDVKTVSDYDENQIFHLTRRNSNFRTNATQNYQTKGAVLLTRSDLGNFSTWENKASQDNFEVTFTAAVEDWHAAKDSVVPGTLGSVVRANFMDLATQVKILFIYNDHSFSGTYHNARFWRT